LVLAHAVLVLAYWGEGVQRLGGLLLRC
jgi:hypothetical protein